MSQKVGEKAMGGEWEEILTHHIFEITEDMTMTFQGVSCNILDKDGKQLDNLGGPKPVTRDVLAGYQCFIMKAWVRFEKR
jgi:hypothetical protein